MVAHDDQAAAGQPTGSRRAFLRGASLAALASASALALPSTSALAAPGRSSAALASAGLVPPDAALTLRMFRSLTLLTIAATLRDRAFGARVQDAALKDLGRQVGTLGGLGGASFDPDTDGICPPWWPWPFPWPPRRFDDVFSQVGDPAIPKAGLVAIDMFRTLSLYNMAFQFNDRGMRASMQKLAIDELQGQYAGLARAGSLAGYDDGDGICPDWWPFPWPRPHAEAAGIPTPQPALALLDLTRSLVSHNIATRFSDISAQQRSVGQARAQIQGLVKTLAASGGAAAWEPGDDLCPPWWPWPWPWPHRLGDILDPATMGDPEPQPNSAIRLTFDMFRSGTVFAIASQIDDQGLAQDLQTQAIAELNAQAQQL
jgi:hypothetical protein